MFSTLSWEIFISATALAIGGYYFITTMLLFHKEMRHWWNSRGQHQQASSEYQSSNIQTSMVGETRKDSAETRTVFMNTEEILPASISEAPDTIEATSSAIEPNSAGGGLEELLQEIKTLTPLIVQKQSTREEAQALFTALLQRYPSMHVSPYKDAVNQFLYEQVRKHFSSGFTLPDINNWWQ